MSSQSQTSKLAASQTLTASYAATNTIATFAISGETSATLDFKYTTGAAETTAYLEYVIEFSPDEGTTWIPETTSGISSNVSTETPLSHKIVGGAGGTVYPAQYMVPLCERIVRVRVKETSVNANFGTLTIWLTVSASSILSRNILPSSSSGGGAVTIADGADVTQGAKADARSTATDTTAVTTMSVLKEISYMEQNPASRAVTIADGSDVAEGALADAVVAAGATGSISAKLRRLTTDLDAFKTANHSDLTAATPAGTNLIGNVGNGKTIKVVTGTISASTDIVAAVVGKRIKVIAFSLISAITTANTVTCQSNASTAIWTTPLQSITGTMTGSNLATSAPSFLFATVAGEKLTLNLSAATAVTYNVTYFDDDAT